MAKLDRVLPDQLRGRVRAAQGTLALPEAMARGTADAALVLSLSAAAGDGQRAQLRYQAGDGRVTERRLDPYGVAFQSGAWYVVGWDHLRSDLRTLRLCRILACRVRAASGCRRTNRRRPANAARPAAPSFRCRASRRRPTSSGRRRRA